MPISKVLKKLQSFERKSVSKGGAATVQGQTRVGFGSTHHSHTNAGVETLFFNNIQCLKMI